MAEECVEIYFWGALQHDIVHHDHLDEVAKVVS